MRILRRFRVNLTIKFSSLSTFVLITILSFVPAYVQAAFDETLLHEITASAYAADNELNQQPWQFDDRLKSTYGDFDKPLGYQYADNVGIVLRFIKGGSIGYSQNNLVESLVTINTSTPLDNDTVVGGFTYISMANTRDYQIPIINDSTPGLFGALIDVIISLSALPPPAVAWLLGYVAIGLCVFGRNRRIRHALK